MRRVRYQVAASLDGYIAGPNGEADWIIMDPDIDFAAHFAQFDTVLMGRRTFEVVSGGKRNAGGMPGMQTFVFSRTLRPEEFSAVTIVNDNASEVVTSLKEKSGKDIWLFGGGLLFRSLLAAGVVDTVELAVMPVLLGSGVPLFPSPDEAAGLTLTGHRVFTKSGIVFLEYDVLPPGRKAR